ncbi:hypothetical protein Glove_326g143 [Diversispora epigaea]|uniref:Uncharacterized protein n=1 Tax=Diversispora epigaea TaxID=1348612 RepID=A0A397HM19_9GLOM|nr:hypothetical protein Glove_326g143 [Diversispora epigaea]
MWYLRDQISSVQMESELNMLELEIEKAKEEFGPMEQVQKTPECQIFSLNAYKRREPTSMKLRDTPPEKDSGHKKRQLQNRFWNYVIDLLYYRITV